MPNDVQKGVNDMAVAIAAAEYGASRNLIRIGTLFQATEDFRRECGLHSMLIANADALIGEATAVAARSYQLLYQAHEVLEDVRKKCSLPAPTPVPQGGGGGGKAAGEY